MIVRNEEQSLGQALASVKPFVDELVVVDTGSGDRTIEIAKRQGARVSHFSWCDDFSAARNYSIEQATGDWIFWMDADDVLLAESGRKMRQLVAEHPPRDVAFWVMVQQESTASGGRVRTTRHGHLKLFPRHPDIRFCYRVHEQVAPAIKRLGFKLVTSQLTVRHANADRSSEGNAKRNERNLRLLSLDLADRPDDPFVLMNLGLAYLHRPGCLPAAVEYTERSIERFQPGSPARVNAHLVLATAYRRMDDKEGELATCRRAHAELPDDASAMLRLGTACERYGRLSEAAACYRKILKVGKLHLSVFHVPDPHRRASIRLGHLYLRAGQRTRAEQLWKEFVEQNPNESSVQHELAKLSIQPYTITVSSHQPDPAEDVEGEASNGQG
jgi:hypothetical protein